jgi:hypothetical protein
MNPFRPAETPSTISQSDSLFRKLVLLVLLISAASLWIVVWFRQGAGFPLLLSTFFADASLGLIAGFGSRFVLRNRDEFLRYLFAISVTLVGMILISFLTGSVLGIGPIRLEERFAEQIREVTFTNDLGSQIRSLGIGSRVLFDFSKLDWADSVHLAISLAMALLSLCAWRPRSVENAAQEPVEIEIAPLPVAVVVSPPAPRSRRGRRSSSSADSRARVRRSGQGSHHVTPSIESAPAQPRVRSSNGSRASVRSAVKKVKDPTLRPKKKRAPRRKAKIQFALVEEHRCPYCLDTVTHRDPRGVKECDVCHTLHHSDCWSITGVCQVPHLNT